MTDPRDFEAFLHRQIPLSRAMGLTVESCEDDAFILSAPLAVNRNHLGTAFGGSLSVIATLAGYGMLWLQLNEPHAHLVIQASTIRYLHPVRGDIRAVCLAPDPEKFANFLATFSRKGKARLRMNVTIAENGRDCVVFSGDFVAVR